MKITIQRTMNVPAPARAHETDAGLDLHVPEGQGVLIRPGAVYTINLGVRVAIPGGYYGQLTLRSSAGKKGLTIPNGVGIIDSGYRGDLKLIVTAVAEPVLVSARDRICQLVVLPSPPVDVEMGVVSTDTDRGEGGFGSTGTGAAGAAMDDQINLTVGGLMRALQDIASRYGVDTPIALPSSADADYEQATAPIIMHAKREAVPDDWDLFHVDPAGKAVAVIS